MTDILDDLRAVRRTGGDTYSSAEVLGMVGRGADEIERLQYALGEALVRENNLIAENERLRAREDAMLRAAIDATWGDALEDGSVPATKMQDQFIAFARASIDQQKMASEK